MENEKWLIDAVIVKRRLTQFIATAINKGVEYVQCKDNSSASEFLKGYERGVIDAANLALGQPRVNAVAVKCKVGDLVYALWEAPVKLKYIIYCAEVKEIRIAIRNCRLTTTYMLEPIDYRGHRKEYRDEDFGVLVFESQKDAEDKLYPCERCVSGTYRSCEGCSCGERKDNGE